jgi:hypothetical protein
MIHRKYNDIKIENKSKNQYQIHLLQRLKTSGVAKHYWSFSHIQYEHRKTRAISMLSNT